MKRSEQTTKLKLTSLGRLSGATAVAAGVAAVVIGLAANPARVSAESGSRACGWLLQVSANPAMGDKARVQNVGFFIEVDKDSGDSICDKASDQIKKSIENDPNNKYPIGGHYGDFPDDQSRMNKWTRLTMKTCETAGAYFTNGVAPYNSKDICSTHPPDQKGMNKSSGAKGDQHIYQWANTIATSNGTSLTPVTPTSISYKQLQ